MDSWHLHQAVYSLFTQLCWMLPIYHYLNSGARSKLSFSRKQQVGITELNVFHCFTCTQSKTYSCRHAYPDPYNNCSASKKKFPKYCNSIHCWILCQFSEIQTVTIPPTQYWLLSPSHTSLVLGALGWILKQWAHTHKEKKSLQLPCKMATPSLCVDTGAHSVEHTWVDWQ